MRFSPDPLGMDMPFWRNPSLLGKINLTVDPPPQRRGACATYKQQTIDRIQYTAGKDRNRMTKAATGRLVW